MAWVLADRYFPRYLMGIDNWVYIVMGIMSALLLSLSIFFHEFGHALMARKFNLPTERIHMFLFGGMAELKFRPMRPMHESLIAIAGPIFSMILSIVSYLTALLVEQYSSPTAHVFYYTALMNLLLAIFNVIPIYPLDGGRALRGLLWQKTSRFYEASMLTFRISSNLIALLFIISFVSWFWFDPMWTLWIAFFALYMMYTALNGRRELVHVPTSDDLIFRLSDKEPTHQIIREIVEADPTYLNDCIVPVMNEGRFEGVIFGRSVEIAPNLSESDLEPFYHEAVLGTFIDIEQANTYEQYIEFLAEFVPVLKRGRLLGLCDPHELRFWLRETSRLRLETDLADTAYYG